MRHVLSTAIVAVVVSLLTATAIGALAQERDGVGPAAVSSINADKVDGKHAVGSGASKAKRAGKLVATNGKGYLPKNIVNGLVTKVRVTTVTDPLGDAAGTSAFAFSSVQCPVGSVVVGGGYFINGTVGLQIYSSRATSERTWAVGGWNPATGGNVTLHATAQCLSTDPAGSVGSASTSRFGPSKLDVKRPR